MTRASVVRKLRKRRGRKLRRIVHKKFLDLITNIDPFETPLLALMGTNKTNVIYHEWVNNVLRMPDAEEGKDFTDEALAKADPGAIFRKINVDGVEIILSPWVPKDRIIVLPREYFKNLSPDFWGRTTVDPPTDGTTT